MFKWLAVFSAFSVLFSQNVNRIIGGDPTMTVSARAGYARQNGSVAGRRVCHVLNWIDVRNDGDDPDGDHCDNAMLADFRRYQERKVKEAAQ